MSTVNLFSDGNKPWQNFPYLNVSELHSTNSTIGLPKSNNLAGEYWEATFESQSLTAGMEIAWQTVNVINTGDPDYIGSLTGSPPTGYFSPQETGLYSINLYLDPITVLAGGANDQAIIKFIDVAHAADTCIFIAAIHGSAFTKDYHQTHTGIVVLDSTRQYKLRFISGINILNGIDGCILISRLK